MPSSPVNLSDWVYGLSPSTCNIWSGSLTSRATLELASSFVEFFSSCTSSKGGGLCIISSTLSSSYALLCCPYLWFLLSQVAPRLLMSSRESAILAFERIDCWSRELSSSGSLSIISLSWAWIEGLLVPPCLTAINSVCSYISTSLVLLLDDWSSILRRFVGKS